MMQSLFCASCFSLDFSEPDQKGHGKMLLSGSDHLHREAGFGQSLRGGTRVRRGFQQTNTGFPQH